ncbi:MAG: glycogen synthase GlgA [Clostridia bacterium]|nr:glycogen synthase GlgA [Clostridia bacterium]
MKILYASSEVRPFAASGGLSDVAGSLPNALRKRLVGARVVLPLYSCVGEEYRSAMTFLGSITVPVAWRRQYCGIFELHANGVIYYFLDNEYYFKRDGLYGYYDDAERFAFFSRAILEILPYIGWKPDMIHCNDWQTALTPVYLSAMYSQDPFYSGIKTVFTIHNIQYQGKYGPEIIGDVVGLPDDKVHLLEYDGCMNFLKGAIECADRVTTVSPTYAKEILDPWYSFGLDPILREREWKLRGILNGIDVVSYDPQTDKAIAAPYSAKDVSGKAECKTALQKELNLPAVPDVPVIGVVSRLVSHKGFDLVKAILEELLQTENVQFAVLGAGDWQYESFFGEIASRYPAKFGLRLGFEPDLARRVYAGSDIFLMPSKSEPCGLSQMLALRYGSVPIVRETGGLKDSVSDSLDGEGTGFTFAGYNAGELLYTVRRALGGYSDPDGWEKLVRRGMSADFSWKKSAGEYVRLYKEILGAES